MVYLKGNGRKFRERGDISIRKEAYGHICGHTINANGTNHSDLASI